MEGARSVGTWSDNTYEAGLMIGEILMLPCAGVRTGDTARYRGDKLWLGKKCVVWTDNDRPGQGKEHAGALGNEHHGSIANDYASIYRWDAAPVRCVAN